MEFRSYWNPVKFYQDTRIANFKPKVRFSFDVGNFIVKTAQCPRELKRILKLRYQVFIEEGLGKSNSQEVDFDKFDLLADHILLIDKTNDEVIGTYRILSSDFVRSFYSAQEFTIDQFLIDISGLKLELGRACIHRDYRNGLAIHLIWKGLGRYASHTGADYMFGCTSVKSPSKFLVRSMMSSLVRESYNLSDFNIKPKLKYRFFIEPSVNTNLPTKESLIPPLLKSYIQAGAKIYGEPAYDREFKCFDIFTCLDLKSLPEKYKKKYFGI